MDQTDAKFMAMAGLLLNSALYLGGVIAAGLLSDSQFAWKFGLISAALTYIGYGCQLSNVPRKIIAVIVWSSIATGVVAGLALL